MNFDAIRLKLASPEDILKWSHGEVLKPETINYRTQRPEKDGLFSERIFGPTKDWECYCGKYRRPRYKGVICDKCGVEVTRASVRRERMGHIKLAAPVSHIWFLKNVPSKIGLMLDLPLMQLERVLYYAAYVVTAVDAEAKARIAADLEREFKARKKAAAAAAAEEAEALKDAVSEARAELEMLRVGAVLSEADYHALAKKFGEAFEAGMGAEAIRAILKGVDLKSLAARLDKEIVEQKDTLREVRLLKRLKLVRSMHRNGVRPEWMIIEALPVLPPDLRPMVALDGGRYATSDLNDLYRRVINRNNRLKKLLELKAPEVIITNEKRMLQEAVDALLDNSARFGAQQLSAQHRPLRSLADMLKGKQGRFRQNLLGKRVDYSGRSVIVIGPNLGLGECGLPKRMALELFKPFVIGTIIARGLAHNIRNANRLIEQAPPEVWAILEEVIADRLVLLNRAPTLHRLGVQAFKPVLTESLAIQIPPLVCTAFNADFDGDQMAVHLPLSAEAQREAHALMHAPTNLLKPATGDPIVTPTQDIVLGCYYLTKADPAGEGAGRRFATRAEALLAHESGVIAINAPVKIGPPSSELETTAGRLIFNDVLPPGFPFVNDLVNKKALSRLIGAIIAQLGFAEAASHLDAIKRIGFQYASRSGISWGMHDLIIPPEKEALIARAEKEVEGVKRQYDEGLLTDGERRERVVQIWKRANDELNKVVVPRTLPKQSAVYSIIDSGARGSWSQPGQMMGMKGLVQNPRGEVIELPVRSSFKEGLSVLEYFISTHGARKGLTDTALKTASAGYLTRRLVDVSQDLIIREEDCGTEEGIEARRADGAEFGHSFASRLFSRTLVAAVRAAGGLSLKGGEIVSREAAAAIEADPSIGAVTVRSPIACRTLFGLCSACYGFDLGTNQPIRTGEAVGIVAAQSIGEPGTQLTMRTFHIGGIAGADITHGLPRVEELFEARHPKGKGFLSEVDGVVAAVEERGSLRAVRIAAAAGKGKPRKTSPRGKSRKVSPRGGEPKEAEYLVPRIAEVFVRQGDAVEKGTRLSEGPLDLKELYELKGAAEVQRYIIQEVQKIYISEGAAISNKHIEVIIRQMFSRVKVRDAGETEFVVGDVLEKSVFLEVNRAMRRAGKRPAKGAILLMGITKVALSTQSFLSAASFIETARVLINAAIEGRVDPLRGLKENVIIGRLIPAGTGYRARGAEAPAAPAAVGEGEEKREGPRPPH